MLKKDDKNKKTIEIDVKNDEKNKKIFGLVDVKDEYREEEEHFLVYILNKKLTVNTAKQCPYYN